MSKIIKDGYCNGCFGRRYDLHGAEIESEGSDWVVIRTKEGEPLFASFADNEDMEETINEWCKGV
jgi:hypothetical protein